jgi:hypothetical protein
VPHLLEVTALQIATRANDPANIPLTLEPRHPKISPHFDSFVRTHWDGVFEPAYSALVGLHAQSTYDFAKEVAAANVELVLERDQSNAVDRNAVAAYTPRDSSFGRQFVGYLAAEDVAMTAAMTAPLLDEGCPLIAIPYGSPRGGRQNRAGMLEVRIECDG